MLCQIQQRNCTKVIATTAVMKIPVISVSLSDALSKITPLVTKHKQVSPNEEEELKYDIKRSTTCINLWKAHILATINQEHAKKRSFLQKWMRILLLW